MRHSSEKRRDMARSILPSRSRSAAQDLALIRRRARRTYNRHLAAARTDPEGLALSVDPRDYPNAEIRQVVQRRRAADKLNHFERWAVHVTADMAHEDRLGKMRAILPKGVIGAHALSHLQRVPEINPIAPPRPWLGRQWARRDDAFLSNLRDALLEALEQGSHRELNRAMKRAAVGEPPTWRVLGGVHDLDDFVHDVMCVAAWSAAVEAFFTRPPNASRGPLRTTARHPSSDTR